MEDSPLEILVPITFFIVIGTVIVMAIRARSQERRRLADLVQSALDKGQPLPPEMFRAFERRGRFGGNDLRRGVVLVALALAFALFGALNLAVGNYWGFKPMAASAFPGLIGVAYLALAYINRSKPEAG